MINLNTSIFKVLEKFVTGSTCSTPSFKTKASNVITVSRKEELPYFGDFHPFWIDEVVTKLFHMLDLPDIKNLMQVSQKCYSISDKNLWFEIGRLLNVFQVQLNICPSNSQIALDDVKKLAQTALMHSRGIAGECLMPYYPIYSLHKSLEDIVDLLLASEKIDDINLLNTICKARDIIVFWNKIALQIPNQEAPQLIDIDSLDRLFTSAAEFQAWCDTFQADLGQIIELNLQFCKITHLPSQISYFVNLRFLNLEDNRLSSLPSEIGNLVNLHRLEISFNIFLYSLPSEMGNLINLQEFYCSCNKLEFLPSEICNLNNLEILQLDRNKLIFLPPKIGNLTSLREFHLISNHLTELPDEIGKLTNLQNFQVSNNQLTKLPDTMGNLIKLQTFDVSNNQLIILPTAIGSLLNLDDFVVSDNQLIVLPDTICNLINLRRFDASNNKLTVLPDEIGTLINLQYFNISNNQLTALPNEIINLNNLSSLVVCYNQLAVLPNGIDNLNNLVYINVSNNKLAELPNEIKTWLYVQNRSFDIDGNEISLKERVTFFAIHYLANFSLSREFGW